MSEGIKQMLAGWEKLAEERRAADKGARLWGRLADETFAFIDKAAPFMDENHDPTKWRPSEKLKITYWVAASCGRPEAAKEALQFIHDMLMEARRRWIEDLHPDPWVDDPKAHT